jgi:RNA polymerase sigma factor (sigma-70 family)
MWHEPESSVLEEFWATVERLKPTLIESIRNRRGIPYEDAEDIVHEAVIRAYSSLERGLKKYMGDFNPELHLRGAVKYCIKEYYTQKKRCSQFVSLDELDETHKSLLDDSYLDLPDTLTQRDERNIQRFRQTFNAALPSERQQRVLQLVAEDYDLTVVAYVLGISHDNARRLKSEAVERLGVNKEFCQACRDLGLIPLPPEWLVGELLEQAFSHIRRRTAAQPSEESNSAEVTTVQESTVRSFWKIVDSCLDDDTDRQLLRLVLGDDFVDIEQAAKVLCLDATTAKRRFNKAFRQLRCSEKLYKFCLRNKIITPTEVT